jgi:hypothetical protein
MLVHIFIEDLLCIHPLTGVCFYGVPDLSTLDLKSIKIPIQAHFGNNDTMKGFSDPEVTDNTMYN